MISQTPEEILLSIEGDRDEEIVGVRGLLITVDRTCRLTS